MERTILILTTLPHYCAIKYTKSYVYISIIIASTTMSIVWHSLCEYRNQLYIHPIGGPTGIIMEIDYGLALLWTMYEMWRGFDTDIYPFIVLSNIVVFVWNQLSKNWIEHSIWHLVSAFKSVFVAYCIMELYWE
jgi:hypothetical protein